MSKHNEIDIRSDITIRQWERSSKAAFDGWQKALDGWKLTAEQYGAHLDAEIKRLEERK